MGHDPNNLHRFKGSTVRNGKSLDFNSDHETPNKQVNLLDANSDDKQVFDSTSGPNCNLNALPDLNLDLTLCTNYSCDSKT